MNGQKVDDVSSKAIISTSSKRWSNESDGAIRHPPPPHSQKKLPKILVWKDLFVSVFVKPEGLFSYKKSSKTKAIIKSVSGVAEPGQILAIMGESGAGKTTLLNVLTHRFRRTLQIEGEVNVNGEILASSEMRKVSAFVQQFDLFEGSMTVREYLLFFANLRMGRDYTQTQRSERVEEVLTKMGLHSCQHACIGQKFTKSISLGEKKRLSFACELLNNPGIIFCDEPTSGLDAYMAKQVIMCLKQLAKEDGCTVIITIHQPSSQIFEMIDRVCFMGCGQVSYFGPTKKVPAFFASIGYMMPVYTNPAEFAIKSLSLQENETLQAFAERIDDVAKTYQNSALAKDYRERTHGPISERRKVNNEDVRSSFRYNASWCTQFWWLFKRAFFKTLRDPLMIRVRLLHVVLTAAFISMLYFKSKIQAGTVINGDGLMFNVVRDSFFAYMSPSVLVFVEEFPILLRENKARVYSLTAYFVAKNLAEIPQFMMLPLIYTTILYFATGMMFPGSAVILQYFQFATIAITMTFVAISFGYMAACIFGRVEIAMQYMPMINFPMLCLCGFFMRLSSIPAYFQPLAYVSWYRYSFEALMINLWSYHGKIQDCEVLTISNTLPCGSSTSGIEHLEHAGMHTESYYVWINIGVLFATALGIRIIALIALAVRSYNSDA